MREGTRDLVRRSVAVTGVVQGVGFRPFVHRLASRHALVGFVRNRAGDVIIEVEGDVRAVDAFVRELGASPAPFAQVDGAAQSARGDLRFRIEVSDEGPALAVVTPDAATCDACLRELRDPRARRFAYPFVNCAHCGPRLTIVAGVPYDRERTTMKSFAMCEACGGEYEDPNDRRFHAQPIACPVCGPKLRAVDPEGVELSGAPIAIAIEAIRRGQIVAIKGIGGFHLACAATHGAAVRELRRRKEREEKPIAIMVAGLDAAEELCEISPLERDVLASPARPIVLLRKRAGERVAEGVAPGRDELGVMLPHAPLHYLILDGLRGGPLVMTEAGNRSDEPIAFEDADALARLGPVADVLLLHDRPIRIRCDDSIVRVMPGPTSSVTPVRRSRGYAARAAGDSPRPRATDPGRGRPSEGSLRAREWEAWGDEPSPR